MRHLVMTAVLAATLISAPARADDAQLIGVIDTTKIMHESEAAKGIQAALDGKRKEFAAQISKEQENLRSAGQKFEKKKAEMTKEEGEAARKTLNDKLFNLQKMIQGREVVLDKSVNEAMMKLRQETKAIVTEVAKERKLSAVLTQDAVMLSTPEMDITADVIKRLNDKVKKIAVEWSDIPKDKKAG